MVHNEDEKLYYDQIKNKAYGTVQNKWHTTPI